MTLFVNQNKKSKYIFFLPRTQKESKQRQMLNETSPGQVKARSLQNIVPLTCFLTFPQSGSSLCERHITHSFSPPHLCLSVVAADYYRGLCTFITIIIKTITIMCLAEANSIHFIHIYK